MPELPDRVRAAVKQFWHTRTRQSTRQGSVTGRRDAGARSAVTGGAQMNGFVDLVRDLLLAAGVPPDAIHTNSKLELPGWFRPEKCWDLVIVLRSRFVAAVEFKSQVGSFGNNFNNRTEEALGSATDIWAAYREGGFKPSPRPWLGYLMLLEQAPKSIRPVGAEEPHFKVFPEFRGASYARRYELLMLKLLRDRLYDGGCFLLSDATEGRKGAYNEPNVELSFARFVEPLLAHATTAVHHG